MTTVKRIFSGLNPYSVIRESGKISESDLWEFYNKERYRIKKYLLEYSGKMDATYVATDPAFENAIKKNPLLDSMLKPREPEVIHIKEIPLGITEDDKLICLKKTYELPRFFVFGKVGQGKTILSHRLVDYMYNMFNYKLINMNDWKFECRYWAKPNFYSQMKILGEYPGTGLPIVLLVPTIKDRTEMIHAIPKIYVDIYWKHFVDRIDAFADLGASEKYLAEIKDSIKDCRSVEDFQERLAEAMPERSDVAMRKKIQSTFLRYVNLGILRPSKNNDDFQNGKAGCGLIYIFQNGKLISDGEIAPIALARIGLVPTIVTSDLQVYDDFYQRMMKFWIDRIVDKKNTDKDFRKEELIIYIDELSSFCSLKKKSIAIGSIKGMIQRGRLLNLGAILVTQNISEIQSEIVSNCDYYAVFAMPSDRDVTILSNNLNLDKAHRDTIKKLDKFECLLISKDRPFVIYDLENNEIREENGTFKVRTFLSLGEHEWGGDPTIQSSYEIKGDFIDYPIKILEDNNLVLSADKEYPNAYDPFHRRIKESIKKNAVDQRKNFKLPRLVEGVSIARYFYEKQLGLISKTYEEIKEMGFRIVYTPEGYYTIMKLEKIRSPPMTMLETQPNDIKFILYNDRFKQARLIGRGVKNKPITLEPMIKR